MTFRAVIFDIGGVLNRIENQALHREWEARLGLPQWGLVGAIWLNPVAERALIGQATQAQVWAFVGDQFSLNADELEMLQADYWSTYELDAELLAFTQALRPKVKVGILSDAFLDARELVEGRFGEFDVMVFSAEEGVRKPDLEIYRRALSRLGVAAEEAIFVDDILANVEGAQALGIHAIHFTDSATVRAEISRLIDDTL